MKVVNQFNFKKTPGKPLRGKSLTVPDDTMTISEIMLRFARGMPLGGRADVYYDEDNEFDTLKDYDLTEIQEMKAEHAANYEKYSKNAKKFKEKLDKENSDKQFYERLKTEGYAKDKPKETSSDV